MYLVAKIALFSGMKRNWLSLAKAFLKDLNRPVYTLASTPTCFPYGGRSNTNILGFKKPWSIPSCGAHDLLSNG